MVAAKHHTHRERESRGEQTVLVGVLGVCGHEWKTQPNYRCFQGYGCPECFKSGRSRSEEELYNYVAACVGSDNVYRHVRGLAAGNKEVDVFVPYLNVAFEFNGLFWHGEGFVGRTYHRDKTVEVRENGVRLVHIWEDDWENRRRIIERMIDVALGVDVREKVGARQCTVAAGVPPAEVREFLIRNHLLGAPRVLGQVWGLRQGDELVAVLVAKRSSTGYTITRYATSKQVRGGFTRLLARVERLMASEGGGVITTFSDNTYSAGDLYELAGFDRDGDVAPDYMYATAHGARRHKFNYRKKKFKTNPALQYQEGLTERELAELNGLFRVYDAGKVRWTKQVDEN